MTIVGPVLVLVLLAATQSSSGSIARETEIRLAPGRFPSVAGAVIGPAVTFENDIDSARCFPLQLQGRTILWIHRAHRTGSRLFVSTCERYETTTTVTAGAVYGGVSRWWFEATLGSSAESPIALRRLDLPGWNLFSNAAFCGDRVAYWAFDRDGHGSSLSAQVVRLVEERRAVQSGAFGPTLLETDNRECLERPLWSDSCRQVEFDATRQAKGRRRLRIE